MQCAHPSVHVQSSVSVTVFVYYVAVRTIVLSRDGSNLARPVIIHGFIYVPSTPHCGFSVVSPTSIEVLLRPTQSQSDEPSDLRGYLSLTTQHRCTHALVYTAPCGHRRSPIQLWTGLGVA